MRLGPLLARQKVIDVCVFSVLLVAGGCAEMRPTLPRLALPQLGTRPVAPVAEPQPAMAPLPEVAMVAPVPVVPAAPVDATTLRARYGAPDFVRREPDSELWRYDGAGCAVFFFLYRDGDAMRIRYTESMPRGVGMAADPKCVESLNAHPGAMS